MVIPSMKTAVVGVLVLVWTGHCLAQSCASGDPVACSIARQQDKEARERWTRDHAPEPFPAPSGDGRAKPTSEPSPVGEEFAALVQKSREAEAARIESLRREQELDEAIGTFDTLVRSAEPWGGGGRSRAIAVAPSIVEQYAKVPRSIAQPLITPEVLIARFGVLAGLAYWDYSEHVDTNTLAGQNDPVAIRTTAINVLRACANQLKVSDCRWVLQEIIRLRRNKVPAGIDVPALSAELNAAGKWVDSHAIDSLRAGPNGLDAHWQKIPARYTEWVTANRKAAEAARAAREKAAAEARAKADADAKIEADRWAAARAEKARSDEARQKLISEFLAAVASRKPESQLPVLSNEEQSAVLGRAFNVSRQRSAAANVSFDPEGQLLPEAAQSVVAAARASLARVEAMLAGDVDEYNRRDPGKRDESLNRIRALTLRLQQLLASDKCSVKNHLGCEDLKEWYVSLLRQTPEVVWKLSYAPLLRGTDSMLDLLICHDDAHDESQTHACRLLFDLHQGWYGQGWWGIPGAADVAARAIGYGARACASELKQERLENGSDCYGLAKCLTGSHSVNAPDRFNPCGAPDLDLARTVFAMACARNDSLACRKGPNLLAEAIAWKEYGPRLQAAMYPDPIR